MKLIFLMLMFFLIYESLYLLIMYLVIMFFSILLFYNFNYINQNLIFFYYMMILFYLIKLKKNLSINLKLNKMNSINLFFSLLLISYLFFLLVFLKFPLFNMIFYKIQNKLIKLLVLILLIKLIPLIKKFYFNFKYFFYSMSIVPILVPSENNERMTIAYYGKVGEVDIHEEIFQVNLSEVFSGNMNKALEISYPVNDYDNDLNIIKTLLWVIKIFPDLNVIIKSFTIQNPPINISYDSGISTNSNSLNSSINSNESDN